MMPRVMAVLIFFLLSTFLTACVTSVDPALPFARLPEVTVAIPFRMVASPSHPASYLSSAVIPAGAQLQVIGTDENAAWLLVLYEGLAGWMPSFYSRNNVGRLQPAIVAKPLSGGCTQYLASTSALNEEWVATVAGSVVVLGSIYRSQTAQAFEKASLMLEIDGNGVIVASDYLHTPLTPSSGIVIFGFSIHNLGKGSRISFRLADPGREPLPFQSAIFSNDCSEDLHRLPVGKLRVPNSRYGESPVPSLSAPSPAAKATPMGGGAGRIVFYSSRDDNDEIYVMDTDGSNQTRLTNRAGFDKSPIWSPDGRRIVYVAEDNEKWDLWAMNSDGTAPVRLTTDGVEKYPDSYSQDGRKILFGRRYTDTIDQYVMNADGSGQVRLTTDPAEDWCGRWSPDGTEILFVSSRSGSWGIYRMKADGTSVIRVADSAGIYGCASWHPSGKRIAFSSNGDIYSMNPDGAAWTRLTSGDANDVNPSWSPDGRLLTFTSIVDGNNEIYTMHADGSGLTRLTRNKANDDSPSWQPGGAPTVVQTPSPTPSPTANPPSRTPTPTHISSTDTPPGAILEVGEEWRKNDVGLRLTRFELNPGSSWGDNLFVGFEFRNYTSDDLMIVYDGENFLAVANTGESLPVKGFYNRSFWCGNVKKLVPAGARHNLEDSCFGGGYLLVVTVDFGDESITEIIIRAAKFSRITDARWRIRISR